MASHDDEFVVIQALHASMEVGAAHVSSHPAASSGSDSDDDAHIGVEDELTSVKGPGKGNPANVCKGYYFCTPNWSSFCDARDHHGPIVFATECGLGTDEFDTVHSLSRTI